jgi:hypothetical protein
MDNIYKQTYINKKIDKRDDKRKANRQATAEEVIYIFEKILEGWTTIRIYNTIIQNNPNSNIDKKHTEKIATGHCKISDKELSGERFQYYKELREKVYEYRMNKN